MVDLHLHILPGLDDGAEDLETAVRMAKMAAHSGVFHMAATSHGNYYDYTLEEYRESFERLQRELVIRQIPVKLYPGMEIFMDENAGDLLECRELLTLNGTKYVLIEFDFEENVEKVCKFSCTARLCASGKQRKCFWAVWKQMQKSGKAVYG